MADDEIKRRALEDPNADISPDGFWDRTEVT